MQHSEISVGTHGYFAAGLVLAIETSLARPFIYFQPCTGLLVQSSPGQLQSAQLLVSLLMIPTLKGEISLISYLICLEEDVQGLFTLVVN